MIDDQLALIPSPQVPLEGLIKQVETCTLETQGVLPMGIWLYSKLLTISEMGNTQGKIFPALPAIKIWERVKIFACGFLYEWILIPICP